jgi:hypothetical protein
MAGNHPDFRRVEVSRKNHPALDQLGCRPGDDCLSCLWEGRSATIPYRSAGIVAQVDDGYTSEPAGVTSS